MGGLGFLKNALSDAIFDFLKKLMPRTLFGRSILIVVLPIILYKYLLPIFFMNGIGTMSPGGWP